MKKMVANAVPLPRSGIMPILSCTKCVSNEPNSRVVHTTHRSGASFLIAGSVSESQNAVVAVKAADAVEIRIDATATFVFFSAFSSATS
jgi:hypothetical protein